MQSVVFASTSFLLSCLAFRLKKAFSFTFRVESRDCAAKGSDVPIDHILHVLETWVRKITREASPVGLSDRSASHTHGVTKSSFFLPPPFAIGG